MDFLASVFSRLRSVLRFAAPSLAGLGLVSFAACSPSAPATAFPLTADSIPIRDPFILTDPEAGLYYLYARTAFETSEGAIPPVPVGVQVYLSRDLVHWSEPRVVLTLPESSWARGKVWAPEVHRFQDRYYLFVTLTSKDQLADQRPAVAREGWPELVRRGTQIFVSETPTGPFHAFANEPQTPVDWMALDGTLWVENGKPYMVFCHAWQQIEDGTMVVLPLSPDLGRAVGEPQILFRASDAPWGDFNRRGYVTNGPYLHRLQDGKLILIWSSYGTKGYAVGQAASESGSVFGPWVQSKQLLFEENGGHAGLFHDLQGKLNLVLHQPNSPRGAERIKIFPVEERDGLLRRIDRPGDVRTVKTNPNP